MEYPVSLFDMLNSEKKRDMETKRAKCKSVQIARRKKRNEIVDSIKCALQNTVVPYYLCDLIASFVRLDVKQDLLSQPDPLKIILSYQISCEKTTRRFQLLPVIDNLLDCEHRTLIDMVYSSISEKRNRFYPNGLREHLTRMTVVNLRALARKMPWTRCSGLKSFVVDELMRSLSCRSELYWH
tara:strand:- start:164 stop:712 length:549 start_codon:yes stop_codon:yes gene_type:complete